MAARGIAMITHEELERYAQVMIWGMKTARSGRFKKKDIVAIRYHTDALPLAERIYEKVAEMGFNPVVRAGLSTRMETAFYDHATADQLKFIPPGEKELYQNLSGSIFLYAPSSITHLGHVDPRKIAATAIAQKPMRDILVKREEKGLFGWTLCLMPTDELARHAKLTPEQYWKQIAAACFLDHEDPVAQWRKIFQKARTIKKRLNELPVDYFHVQSENVDLKIHPGEKRRWIGVTGHNIPSFELFLSPDYRKTKGIWYSDQPSFRTGNYVEKVRIEFSGGKAVSATAQQGEEFLNKQLAMDAGACRVGEFSLTDKRFSNINQFMANTLFDENFGGENGNCHIALGASYSDTYNGDPGELDPAMKKKLGFNDSALHWDLVNTEEKTVTAHLKPKGQITIYGKGRFFP